MEIEHTGFYLVRSQGRLFAAKPQAERVESRPGDRLSWGFRGLLIFLQTNTGMLTPI